MGNEPTDAQFRALLRLNLKVVEIQGLSRREAWGLIRMAKQIQAANNREKAKREARERAARKPLNARPDLWACLNEMTSKLCEQRARDKWQKRFGKFQPKIGEVGFEHLDAAQ